MRLHSSDEVVACEKHPKWAEDDCVECELDAEFEARKNEDAKQLHIDAGIGRMIYKFSGRKSEFVKKLEAIKAFAGRKGLIAYLEL